MNASDSFGSSSSLGYMRAPDPVDGSSVRPSSFDYMRQPDSVIPKRNCKKYCGKSVVIGGLSAATAVCVYARILDYSTTASTGAMLGAGFLSGALTKEILTDRSFTAINSFLCRWGFEIFQFLTQLNLNKKELQGWFGFDPNIINKTTLALITTQAGHAVFNEILAELTSSHSSIPRRSSGDLERLAQLPLKTNKLLGLPRNNKGLFITQTTKIAIAISLLAIGIFACENSPNAYFACINGGTCLGTHSIGITLIQKLQDYWKEIREEFLEMTLPDPPGGPYMYQRENVDSSLIRRTTRRASCCFRFLKTLEKACKLFRQPLMGLILYAATAERTKRINLIASGIIGISSGAADAKIRYDFEHGLCPYENPVPKLKSKGSWRQIACEGIKEHFSDPNNIIKDALLLGMIAWFAYGITTLDDTAPKIGIALLLSSLFVGYGVTKLVDSKFRNLESTPIMNSLYYHVLQNPDYLLFFFTFLKSMSGKMGKNAYTSSTNALIADLGWVSLGLAAGNNRALQNSSQPATRKAVPIAKTLFALVIWGMILDQLA